jgi:hypothetical protein
MRAGGYIGIRGAAVLSVDLEGSCAPASSMTGSADGASRMLQKKESRRNEAVAKDSFVKRLKPTATPAATTTTPVDGCKRWCKAQHLAAQSCPAIVIVISDLRFTDQSLL